MLTAILLQLACVEPCAIVPFDDNRRADWIHAQPASRWTVHCYCAAGSVGNCYVIDADACEGEDFDSTTTNASPVVLGPVTLTAEEEADLRAACAEGADTGAR